MGTDRTLVVGGILNGRYDRSIDGMTEIIERKTIGPWAAVDLRLRARSANAKVREAAVAPTHTQALAVIGGMSLPVEAVEEYQAGENGGIFMHGYRGWVNLERHAATIAVVRVD